jgi:uncharacterized protein involved in response to NO
LRLRGELVRIAPRPALEAASALALLAFLAVDAAGRATAAGQLALLAAALVALRVTGWHTLRVLHDPDTWPLHAGFVWLALGLVLAGLGRLGLVTLPDAGALHALAAGGIGTVTVTMMLRVARQRSGELQATTAALHALQALLLLAVLLRVAGGWALPEGRAAMMWAAGSAWAVAFGAAAAIVLRAAFRAPLPRD